MTGSLQLIWEVNLHHLKTTTSKLLLYSSGRGSQQVNNILPTLLL